MRCSKEDKPEQKREASVRVALIIGGGLAGLSAAIYLGRSRRDTR